MVKISLINFNRFYPRGAMLARYVFARVTCLSVRLSHMRSMTLDDLELELL